MSGRAALHMAAQGGRVDVLQEILGRDVDVDAKDLGGETALHISAYSCNVRDYCPY